MYIGNSCGVIRAQEKNMLTVIITTIIIIIVLINLNNHNKRYYMVFHCFWSHNKPINSDKNDVKIKIISSLTLCTLNCQQCG